MKSRDKRVENARANFDRLRRGPLLVDMVLTEPAMRAERKKDDMAALGEAAAGNDSAKVATLCRRLVKASESAPLIQVGEWESGLKVLSRNAKVSVVDELKQATESVGVLYRERALRSDRRPEEVRRKADEDLLDAAKRGDLEGVKRAVAYGADVHAKDGRGMTAMLHAMGEEVYFDIPIQKHPEIVDFLRDHMQELARGRQE